MELQNFSAVLFVRDMETSRNFYSKILNLTVTLDLGKYVVFKGGLTLWEISTDHPVMHPFAAGKSGDSSPNLELCFETWNLTEAYGRLKGKNVEFLHEIREEPWGQFALRFFDPDRHLIEVGECMEQYVSRLHKEGMDIARIAEKTGLPMEVLQKLIVVYSSI